MCPKVEVVAAAAQNHVELEPQQLGTPAYDPHLHKATGAKVTFFALDVAKSFGRSPVASVRQ